MRRFVPVLVLALVASVVSVLPVSGQEIDDSLRPPEDTIDFEAEEIPEEPVVSTDGSVRVTPIVEPSVDEDPKSGEESRSGWKPGRATAAVAAGRDVAVGDSPVEVKLNRGNGNGQLRADSRVNVLAEELAEQLSPFGAAVSIDFAEARGNGRVRPDGSYVLSFDLSDVNLGSPSVYDRLSVTRFDGCDVFEPDRETVEGIGEVACESAVELTAEFEIKGRKLVVTVDEAEVAERVSARRDALVKSGVRAVDLDATRGRKPAADEKRAALLPDADAGLEEAVGAAVRSFQTGGLTGFPTYAVTSGASGASGSYASPLVPTLTDAQVGVFTGSAETSYPVPLPAAAAGPAPSVTLVYSSGSIDGLTMNTNTQSGAAGVGWSLAAGGSITRGLKPCNDPAAVGDLCISGSPNEVYSLNLAGRSSSLVLVDGSDPNDLVFRMESDPFWRIRLHTGGSANGSTVSTSDHLDQWWSVETPDGTLYTLGTEDQSVDWLPVWYPSGGCSATYALCDTARQWNVDTVTDVFGNQMTYEWDQEFNWYNARGISTTYKRQYVRASNLSSIEYGANPSESAPANARVEFSYEWRCGAAAHYGHCANETPTSQAWPAAFLDTPGDLWCGPYETGGLYETICSQKAPTFWSQLRLTGILAQVKDGNTWATVGNHDVATEFVRDTGADITDSNWVTSMRTIQDRPTDISGGSYRWHGFDPLYAEDADATQGVTIGDIHDIGVDQGATGLSTGDYIKFEDVWLGESGALTKEAIIRMSAWGNGTIEIRRDSQTGPVIGKVVTNGQTDPDQYQFRTFPATNFVNESGVHDIYLVATGNSNSFANVSFIRFGRENYTVLPEIGTVDFASDGWDFRDNRVNHTPAGTSAMRFPRIKEITNQLGGKIEFTYGQDQTCTGQATPINGAWYNNDSDCFPQWDTSSSPNGFTIFHKWTVQTMTRTAGGNYAPPVVTSYDYAEPFWGFGNNVDSSHDTWNTFRGYNIVTVSDAAAVTNAGKTEYRFFQGSKDENDNNNGPAYPGTVQNSSGTNLTDHYALRGQPYEVRRMTLAGTVLNRTRTTYLVDPTTAGTDRDDPHFTAPSNVNTLTDGSATTVTAMTYGNWGEQLSVNEQGSSAGNDNRTTVFRHYNPTTNSTLGAWRGPHPCVTAVRTGNSTAIPSDNNASGFVRYEQLFYDGATSRTCNRQVTEPVVTNRDVATSSTGRVDYQSDTDSRGRIERTKTPNENATSFTFDPVHGQVTETQNPKLWKTFTEYDQFRRPIKTTDVNDRDTTTVYDQYHRIVEVIAPGDSTTNPTVKVTYNTDQTPSWVQTETRLDDTDYSKSVEFMDGFGRNILNRTLSPTLGRNYANATLYDNAGRVHRSSATYTIFNDNVTAFDYPNWGTTAAQKETVYDAAGRVLEARTNKGVSGTISTIFKDRYQYLGFTTRFYDGKNLRTDTTVDGLGRTTQVKEVSASNITTSYVYNAADDLTQVTGPDGAVTTLTYDIAGRKLTMDEPDTGLWQYSYNVNSMLTNQTDPSGTTITFTYDNLDRKLTRKNGSTLLADWNWDPTNNRGRLDRSRSYNGSDGTVIQYLRYDTLGRLSWRQTNMRQPGTNVWMRFRSSTYLYRDDHQLESMRNPVNPSGGVGETVTYDFNDRTGQAIDLQAGSDKVVDNVYWNNAGQLFQRKYGVNAINGSATFLYDAYTLRLYEHRAGSQTSSHAYQRLQYHYDSNSNIRRIRAYRNLNQRQCFTYDNLDRLVEAYTDSVNCNGYTPKGSGNYNETYSYNAAGNLTSRTGNGTYTYGDTDHKHAVTAMSDGSTFAYDDNGNMTDRDLAGQPDQTLSWNDDQRLESLAIAGGDTTTFLYDADGNRTRRTTGNTTTYYIHNGSEFERTGTSGGTFTHYYRIGGDTVAYRDGTTLTWLWSDHLGSSTTTKTATGSVVKQRYTPWGELRTNGNLTTDKHFTGQVADLETGLAYYGARYYDPAVGRFISPDSIVPFALDGQSRNRYSYVRNNPIRRIDPSGNVDCDGIIGGLLCAALKVAHDQSNDDEDTNKNDKPPITQGPSLDTNQVVVYALLEIHDLGYGLIQPITDPVGYVQGVHDCVIVLVQCYEAQAQQFINTCSNIFNEQSAGSCAGQIAFAGASATASASTTAIRTATGGSPGSLPNSASPRAPLNLGRFADRSFEDVVQTRAGPVGVLAEITVDGRHVTISDIAVYGVDGPLVNQVGPGTFIGVRNALRIEAANNGFDTITFDGFRVPNSSSANPGHGINRTYDIGGIQ